MVLGRPRCCDHGKVPQVTYSITPREPGDPDMSDERPLINVVVGPRGVSLRVGALPFAPTMTPDVALGLADRLVEAAAVFEKHYRAFVHDESGTTH